MRKPRSDSPLNQLPDEHQLALYEWVRDLGYEKALILARKEWEGFGSSLGALHGWWHRYHQQVQQNRMLRAMSASDEILRTAGENLPRLEKATAAALQQATFEAVLSGDADRIKDLGSLLVKTMRASTAAENAGLARERFEFDAAKAVLARLGDLRNIATDRALGEGEKIDAIRRRLFGEIPLEAAQ